MMGQSEPIRVLLVDDNRTVLWGLTKLIEGEWPRMSLSGVAHNRAKALSLARLAPHVILLDLDLQGSCALGMLPELLRRSGGRALIYTARRDPHRHRDAMQFGAMGIVEKGEPAEVIIEAIAHVHQGKLWNLRLRDALLHRGTVVPFASSAVMRRIASLTPLERRIIAEGVARFHAVERTDGQPPRIDAPSHQDLTSICRKLELRDRVELFVFAARHGLVDSDA